MFFPKHVNMPQLHKFFFKNLNCVFTRFAKANVQKCIIWLKKSSKGHKKMEQKLH